MVRLNIGIRNPFKYEKFLNLYAWHGKISKHKFWEVEIYFYAHELLQLGIDLSWFGTDHAGPYIEFNLFGYNFNFKIYDNRHWDYEKNQWENYDSEK